MSRLLRDSAERHVKKTIQLMQKGTQDEALKELELAEKDSKKAKANDIFLNAQTIKGRIMQTAGACEEALKIHSFVLKATEEFLSKDPDNEFYQSIFQTNLEAIGILSDIFHRTGHFIQAKNCYELSLSIYTKFLDNEPENIEYQLSVAVILNNLGNLLSDIGQTEEAKNKYKSALKIHEKLYQTHSKNREYQSNVGMTLNNFGFLLMEMGCFEEAKQKYKKSFKILKELFETDPENINYKSKFAMIINNIGNWFSYVGRWEEAEDRYEEALDLRQKILERDQNVSYQSDVAMTLNNLGGILANLGRLEEAKDRYENSLYMRQKIAKMYPEIIKYQSYVGTTLNNLGALLSNMGFLEEAKNKLEKAVDLEQKILERDHQNVSYQSDLANALNSLGIVFNNLGCLKEAEEKYEDSLDIRRKIVERYSENANYRSELATTLNSLGNLFSDTLRIEKAIDRFEEALNIYKELLKIDKENVTYQLRIGVVITNLGNSFYKVENIEEAKDKYIEALVIYEALLKENPENVLYQSYVGTTLNNLASLLKNTGCIEEAKQRYEESLTKYTEPMQYLTIGKKSESIIRLIELNSELAKKGNQYDQMRYLKEAVELCKRYQNFFIKYDLKHERELVTGAGLSAYIDFLLKNIRAEPNTGKRADEYEKAIKAVEELKSVEEDEAISKFCDSTSYYLSGRKLVNESLSSKQPDLERLKQAMEQFKKATETYEKANVCYCVYTGLFEVLTEIEKSEEVDVPKLKKVVEEVTKTLSVDVNPNICTSFKNLPQIFEEKDCKTRDKLLFDFLEKINSIEYRPLENLFEYIHKRTKDYFEEPFNPIKLAYENWKLKIIFDDPEKVKGKLTIKVGNRTLFNRLLNPEERENNSLEIDYLEKKYFPEGKDEITFSVIGQKKPVIRAIDYFESVPGNKKIRILQHDCCNNSFEGSNLRIAAVQLKYHAYGENSIVKLTADEAYYRKVMAILKAVKEKADIVVFPEFSIPFEYLENIQQYADDNGIIVVAGSHYVQEKNLEKYGKLFIREFREEDLRKNISPIVIPDSKIVHNEKALAARDERGCGFEEGMEAGEVNHILKLREDFRVGVMICYEYVNDDFRKRLIRACNVILVPQTNPSPNIFYRKANSELNIQLCTGNKAHVMVNGIYTWGKDKTKIHGGSTGVALTLDKYSYSKLGENETVMEPIYGVMEQFVYIMSINTDFNTSRDTQTGQKPIETRLIHIFEEAEIPDKLKEKSKEFVELINRINSCNDHNELKYMLTKERGSVEKKTDDVETSLIKQFSPLTNKHIQKLDERKIEELKEKCLFLVIPNN
ncbi:MAG TPA: tetratricopeptide repeat protein [Methanosarcina sp.]